MRWLVYFLIGLAILIGAVVLGLPIFAGPFLKDKILETLNQSGTGQYALTTARVKSLFPIAVELNEFTAQLNDPAAQVRVGRIAAKISLQKWSFSNIEAAQVDLDISEPSVALKIVEKSANAAPLPPKEAAPPPALPSAVEKMILALNLRVEKGEIRVDAAPNKVSIKDLNVQAATANLFDFKSPLVLNLRSKVQLDPWLKGELPLSLETKKLFVSPAALKGESLNLDFAGLHLVASGESQIAKATHDWIFDIQMPALEKLSVLPQFLPPGKWQGGFTGKVAVKMAGDSPLAIAGQLRTQNLRGDIELNVAPTQVKGTIAPEVDLDFEYNQVPVIKKLVLKADLTPLTIQYAELFSKPTGIPMAVDAQAHGTSDLVTVDSLNVVLGQLNAALSGTVGLNEKSPSNIRVVIKPTSLAGLERMIRPLQASPLTGQVSANANISGNLFAPEKLAIQLDDLKLAGVRGAFIFLSEDKTLKIDGPFAVNVAGSATIKNFLPVKASMKGLVDLSAMEIYKKEVYQKNKKSPMTLNFDVTQTGQTVVIRQINLDSTIISASGKGKIENPEKPRITSDLTIRKLQLKDLAERMPELKPYQLSGTASGRVALSGTVDPKQTFQQWPLTAVGSLNVDIPQIVLPKPPESTAGPKTAKEGESAGLLDGQDKLPEPGPLLPNWPVMRNSKLDLKTKIGEVKYGDLRLKGTSLAAKYAGGNIDGSAAIERVLGGAVRMPKLSARQLFSKPQFSAQMNVAGVSVPQAISAFMPEYKEYVVRGSAGGNFSVQSPMPQTKNWLKKVSSSGEFKILKLQTKENVIEKVVGEKLSQFAKDKKALSKNPQPLIADVATVFSLENAIATIKNMSLVAVDGNEFQGAGKIGLDMLADLNGTLYLSTVDIGGDVRAANSDAKGRFVVPVHFKGSLSNPSFDVAASTIEEIAENTLKFSAKKAGSDLKDQLKDKAKEKLKKLFK